MGRIRMPKYLSWPEIHRRGEKGLGKRQRGEGEEKKTGGENKLGHPIIPVPLSAN
jgi:hypothetical protein